MPCPAAHPRKGHIRKHVLVSADQDHSSTEVNSIENWAVKNCTKLYLKDLGDVTLAGFLRLPP